MIDQSKLNVEELNTVVMDVQQRMGVQFCPKDVYDTLQYTIRKAELNGKDESYIPILLENELRDFLMRNRINFLGRLNHVRNMSSNSMQFQMSECF